ncbi:hypothetical protein EKK58_09600 [Candidatus Dependentiae bacterium]|nr:MAG: hypothetical protein EKK58_09600 [Candidatus Dependentiae bacterium]
MNRLYDQHHMLFYRKAYDSMEETRLMRRDDRLIIPLDVLTHQALHKEVSCVPPPSIHLARAAMQEFQDFSKSKDYLVNIDNFQKSIDRASKLYKMREIEKHIGQLIIHAIDLQKPFIKSGSVPQEYIFNAHSAEWRNHGKRT